MVISSKLTKIRLFLPSILCILLLFIFSCTSHVKVDGSFNYTDVGNLEFEDINNIKEYEECINYSHNFIDPDTSLNVSPIINKVLAAYLRVFGLGSADQNSISMIDLNKVAVTGRSGSVAISDAVKFGGISKIKFVDYKYKRTGLFSEEVCVIVYGD